MRTLVFDIGGTTTRVASSSNGRTLSRLIVYPTPKKYAEGLPRLIAALHQAADGKKISRVIGGIAAPLDSRRARTVHTSSLPGWYRFSLKRDLQKQIRAPVQLENDAALAGLGEAVQGAGRGHNIVAFLTIGTGVGGARIINGRLDVSALGFEPGDMIVGQRLGHDVHLESLISGSGLARQHRREAKKIVSRPVWSAVERYLALALVNVAVLWSPNIIVIGGSIGRSSSVNLTQVRKLYSRHLTVFHVPPRITRGLLGDSAGLYGALALATIKQNT